MEDIQNPDNTGLSGIIVIINRDFSHVTFLCHTAWLSVDLEGLTEISVKQKLLHFVNKKNDYGSC